MRPDRRSVGSGALLIASYALPAAGQLAAAARQIGWTVYALDEREPSRAANDYTFYGGTDRAAEYAERFQVALIEPDLDLLVRVPPQLLHRSVRYGALQDLRNIEGPVFVKPADPIAKCFDAGVYARVADVRGRGRLDGRTQILVSEAAEWTSEFRCFILEGKLSAWSPYLSFGRPIWRTGCAGPAPTNLERFCGNLAEGMRSKLPPAFVVDVGVLEDGRWAVVEFNPAWCSGILGANVGQVFRVVRRSALPADRATESDRRWVRTSSTKR